MACSFSHDQHLGVRLLCRTKNEWVCAFLIMRAGKHADILADTLSFTPFLFTLFYILSKPSAPHPFFELCHARYRPSCTRDKPAKHKHGWSQASKALPRLPKSPRKRHTKMQASHSASQSICSHRRPSSMRAASVASSKYKMCFPQYSVKCLPYPCRRMRRRKPPLPRTTNSTLFPLPTRNP